MSDRPHGTPAAGGDEFTASFASLADRALCRVDSSYPSLASWTGSAVDLERLNASRDTGDVFAVGTYQCVACPICLEVFTLANPAVLVSCEHSFHLQCLESWRQRSSTCPVCQRSLANDEGHLMCSANTHRARRRQRRVELGTSHTCADGTPSPQDWLTRHIIDDHIDDEDPTLEQSSPDREESLLRSGWWPCLCWWAI